MVRRNRGQLILVGSILIALVIVGLVVIVNGVLFTESAGSPSVTTQIQDANEFDSQSIKDVRSLVFRVSHSDRNVTKSELQQNIAHNVSLLSKALGQSYALSRPISVSLQYSNASVIGNRTVQSRDDNITDINGFDTWSPFASSRTVGWFTLNVNMAETSTSPMYINATNSTSGQWVNTSLRKMNNGNLSIYSQLSGAPNTVQECRPAAGRILLDLYAGEVLTSTSGDCSFNGTDTLESPHDVTFVQGSNLVGKYSIVTREEIGSSAPVNSVCTGSSPQNPCTAPVVWRANISTSFDGEGVSYSNQYNVSIYGEET